MIDVNWDSHHFFELHVCWQTLLSLLEILFGCQTTSPSGTCIYCWRCEELQFVIVKGPESWIILFFFLFYSRHNFWDIFVIFNAMYFMLNVISLILSPSSLCPTSIALQVLCHFHSSTSFSLPKILLYWHYYLFFLLSFWTAILVSRCLSEVHSKVHLFIKAKYIAYHEAWTRGVHNSIEIELIDRIELIRLIRSVIN